MRETTVRRDELQLVKYFHVPCHGISSTLNGFRSMMGLDAVHGGHFNFTGNMELAAAARRSFNWQLSLLGMQYNNKFLF